MSDDPVQALKAYVQHKDDCPAQFTGNPRVDGVPDVCTCGLADTLAALGASPLEQFLADYRQSVEIENEATGEWFWLDEIEKRIGRERYLQIMSAAPPPPTPKDLA